MKRGLSVCVLLLGGILVVAGFEWHQGYLTVKHSQGAIDHQDGSAGTPRPTQIQEISQGRAKPSRLCSHIGGVGPAEPMLSRQASGDSASQAVSTENRAIAMINLTDSEEPEAPIRSWAKENPSAAATFAEQQPDPVVRRDALNQVALVWAETDVTKAIAWASQLPVDEAKADILINLGYELARTEPVKALALAATLSSESGRDDLMVHAVSQWATTDALAATKRACAIPELALRERVLASIAMAMADQTPEAAVILTTQALWPGESQKQAAIAIVQRWAQQDPQGAASWVQQFPAGDLQETAVRNLIAVWSQSGSEKPVEWLNSLPEGAMKAIGADALAVAINTFN